MAEVDFDLRCAECGASLRGLTLSGRCRSCGRPVAGTVDVSALDETTLTVSRDVSCRGCGYNLRTLPLGSVCPECAMLVHISLAAEALFLADPEWLRNVRQGTTYLLFNFVVLPGILILSAMIQFLSADVATALSAAVIPVGFVLPIPGISLLLQPEPDPRRAKALSHARQAGAVGTAAIYLTLLFILLPSLASFSPPEVIRYIVAASAVLCVCGLGAMFVGAGIHLREMARRSSRHRTANLGTVFIIAFPIWLAIVSILVAVEVAGAFAPGPLVLGFLVLPFGVAVYGLWVALLFGSRSALTHALKASRRWRTGE